MLVTIGLKVRCVAVLVCLALTAAAVGQQFEITRSTVDGGGVMRSTGGSFELSGTIGQHDAGVMSGGTITLTGGFWFEIPVGDCDNNGVVGQSDIRSFAGCAAGPDSTPAQAECICTDFDGDGDIDLYDFAAMQIQFSGQ